ncbi:hypothetical protein BV898_19907 [Hypsibius exemplaris]|uniref:Uncharacterized protein n=1 Tax=Hypsibius exemplaris TaxID=2072580 RepID=A0A9X6NMC7_HYPEX|nr:hypothetical protein BV898_19907 [Hypsibius exemplaris]
MAVPIGHRLIVDPQRIKMIGLTGFFYIALLCSQQRGDASPIGCAPRPSVQPALGPEKACVLPEGPVCPFGRQRLRSLHLSCEFDNTSNAETTSAAFHRLPVCHTEPMLCGAPWVNSPFYSYQFVLTDDPADVRDETQNVISQSQKPKT